MKQHSVVGECVLFSSYDHLTGQRLVGIGHADPVIRVSGALLRQLIETEGVATVRDDILHIVGVNHTVIYRLRDYDVWSDTYLAEWPD